MTTDTAQPDTEHQDKHWVRFLDDGRTRCTLCGWESTTTGADAVDEAVRDHRNR